MYQGLATLPFGWVVELPSIPHDFVHELREADGMACRAGAGRLEAAAAGVGDVLSVVWRVEVLAVPASIIG